MRVHLTALIKDNKALQELYKQVQSGLRFITFGELIQNENVNKACYVDSIDQKFYNFASSTCSKCASKPTYQDAISSPECSVVFGDDVLLNIFGDENWNVFTPEQLGTEFLETTYHV